jgi:tellurite resistance protein TehA-like permease
VAFKSKIGFIVFVTLILVWILRTILQTHKLRMDVEHKDRNLSNEIFNFYILPEKDLVKLLGE